MSRKPSPYQYATSIEVAANQEISQLEYKKTLQFSAMKKQEIENDNAVVELHKQLTKLIQEQSVQTQNSQLNFEFERKKTLGNCGNVSYSV